MNSVKSCSAFDLSLNFNFSLKVGTLNNFDIFEVVPTHKSWKEQKIFTLHEDVTPGWLYL